MKAIVKDVPVGTDCGWDIFTDKMTKFIGKVIEVKPAGVKEGLYYEPLSGYYFHSSWLDFNVTDPLLALREIMACETGTGARDCAESDW